MIVHIDNCTLSMIVYIATYYNLLYLLSKMNDCTYGMVLYIDHCTHAMIVYIGK